jgi:hypothetical protein
MRDIILYLHIIVGLSLIVLPIVILLQIQKKSAWLKSLSAITAGLSWLLLPLSGKLYLTFYPATKTLIKAGAWPWAHSIFMETKEHWGLLLPIIATVAAGLVFSGNLKESRRWWILLIIIAILMGIMGRIITLGGMVR